MKTHLYKVPQMPNIDQPPPNLQMQADSWIDYIQNVISLFEQMTKSDINSRSTLSTRIQNCRKRHL